MLYEVITENAAAHAVGKDYPVAVVARDDISEQQVVMREAGRMRDADDRDAGPVGRPRSHAVRTGRHAVRIESDDAVTDDILDRPLFDRLQTDAVLREAVDDDP